ncbi:MAG: 2-oxoacid:ferredoxin oxidoreductase subunit beta, partial [Gammaproteobacteria bacterium]|nr:2-oxoacid:ferredoxin oxidoreductase subunit beta [Gammaproteobacteria bacterium]
WENKLAPHGTGMRPFNPLAIALASGASFIARGFSGDPSGLTRLITEGIEHKGFSFIEVLSPCTTFRPEQKEWKTRVKPLEEEPTDNAAVAAQRIYTLGEFLTGIVYQADLPVWQPVTGISASVEQFAGEFEL